MDLGFAGLVEKIEERFGKWAGTAILAVLCLIILAWGIQLVLTIFLGIEDMVASKNSADRVLGLIAQFVFYSLIGVVLGAVILRFGGRKIQKQLAEADEQINEFKQKMEAERETREAMRAEIDDQWRQMRELKEMIGSEGGGEK